MDRRILDPSATVWIDRLWAHLEDAGEWLVFADWLAERRDPRAVLLRHALSPGPLEEAGTHWARLRDIHRKRGFEEVGALPWELSFLIAARELMRVPAQSHFAALITLIEGVSLAQWFHLAPKLEEILNPWPDRLRDPGGVGFEERFQPTPPPFWWGLVRATNLSFPHLERLNVETVEPWLEPLTYLEALNPNDEEELGFATEFRVPEIAIVGAEVPWPAVSSATIQSVTAYHCNNAASWLSGRAPYWPQLDQVEIIGMPRANDPVDLTNLAAGRFQSRLRTLRLTWHTVGERDMPEWRRLNALEELAFRVCSLGPSGRLSKALADSRRLPRLCKLDLRWSRIEAPFDWAALPTHERTRQFEGFGIPFSRTAEGFLRRTEPFPVLKRLSFSGGAELETLERWLDHEGTLAPQLDRLDLFVDATPQATLAWARALDRWPALTTLTLPVRMVQRREDIEQWLASTVFRGLDQLVLHGTPSSLMPLVEAMTSEGVFPRIVCDLGMRTVVPDLFRRWGFVADDVEERWVGCDDRDWSAVVGA
ncbi:MAG: hypothetical protein AAGA48_27525 [Myxococcota bacterium]